MKNKVVWIQVLFVVMLLFQPSKAQWVKVNGPHGGIAKGLATKDTILFAGLWGAGVFRSTNYGDSWTAVNNGLTPGIQIERLRLFGENLYLAADGAAYRSTNNGDTWSFIGLGGYQVTGFAYVGSYLFASTWGNGIFRSSDGGTNWTEVNNGLNDIHFWDIYEHDGYLFLSTNENFVYRSTNSGDNWTLVGSNYTTDPDTIHCIMSVGSNLYAGTNQGINVSTNNGASWRVLNNGLTYPSDWTLLYNGTYLFAGTGGIGGIYRSNDYGEHWISVGTGVSWYEVYSMAYIGNYLFAGTLDGGIHRSSDNGTNWVPINNTIIYSDVYCLMYRGSNLIVGTNGHGIFTSLHNGDSLLDANGDEKLAIHSMAQNNSYIFAGTQRPFWGINARVFRSSDNGMNWENVAAEMPLVTNITSLATKGDTIYLGSSDHGVLLSSNNGTSWVHRNFGIEDGYITSLAIQGNEIYAATQDSGVFRSSMEDTSWVAVNSGLTNHHVTSLAVCNSNVYAGTIGDGVFISTNSGLTWKPIPPVPNDWVLSFTTKGNALFVGSWYTGIYFSLNKGKDWEAINAGLTTNTLIRSLTISDSLLFAGTIGGGLFRRPLTEILPYGSINGTVYNDFNGNGIQDVNDTGIVGWKVFLKNSNGVVLDVRYTESDGSYLFKVSLGGTYIVNQNQVTGWIQTYPSGTGGDTVAITKYDYVLGQDFGIRRRYTISGYAWNDKNADSIKDFAEQKLAGWNVFVTGTKSDTLITDANGYYSFNDLDSGSYAVTLESRSGWRRVFPAAGNYQVTFTDVIDAQSKNFGMFQPSSISGLVWSDKNQNTIMDTIEIPLQGCKLYLNGYRVDSTLSDSSGIYSFNGLPEGTYTIKEGQSSRRGWVALYPGSGTRIISLPANTDSAGNDFGNSFSVNVLNRWNLVSLPVQVENRAKSVLLPSSISNAFRYAGTYLVSDSLEYGKGYWVKYDTAQVQLFHGDPIPSETLSVQQGWNMVGSISQPVPTHNVLSIPSELQLSQFFGYYNGYVVSDTIEPGKGYWVKANQNGQLIFSSTLSGASFNKIKIIQTTELPPPPPFDAMQQIVIPKSYGLDQNYPNPFNPQTKITYQLPVDSWVMLKVFNALGDEVGVLVNQVQDAGYKTQVWDASNLSSGIYFYRLEAISSSDPTKQFIETKKMLFVK